MTHSDARITNLLDLVERGAELWGTRNFATCADDGQQLSFEGLARQSSEIARRLVQRFGIGPGKQVPLLMPNCLEFLPVYFGVLRAGAVPVPVNIRLKPAEIEFILRDCQASAAIVHARVWNTASEAIAAIPELAGRVAAAGFQPGETPERALPLAELSARGTPSAPTDIPAASTNFAVPTTLPAGPPARPGTDDVAAIIYTSGTTGRPKGAMLTHGNILFNVRSTEAAHGLVPSDVHLLVVPLFHVTGLNTIMPTALQQGGRLVISSEIDPARLLSIIEKFGCTTFFGVPTTFYLLTNLKDVPWEQVRSLRLICYSGAPMAPLTILRLRELFPGVELHNFFGLTETTSVTTVLPDRDALDRAESVGLPAPGVELAIVDDQDHPVAPGEVGELVVRGPSVFRGYFQRPEATAEAIRDGWFHTGDAALLDPQGYLYLRGRKKEMIIVAGENVYPVEVENAICAHPAVQEAAVFGREDRLLGEVVHAAVVLRPGTEASERELKRFLNERLASFKMPRSIRILDRLPRNPSGKVVKREIQ